MLDGFFIYGMGLLGALSIGGGRVAWHRWRLQNARRELSDQLSRSGSIAVLSSHATHGGLELATEESGRTLSLQLLPNHWEFHAFDMGIDPAEHLELRVGHIHGSDDALAQRAAASTRVTRAIEDVFLDHWVVNFCGVREGALVVAADTQQPLWELSLETLQRRFQLVSRLAEALRTGLDLRTDSELCPVCPGQKLEPNVGHLHESVCGHCSGRFLPREAVEQLGHEMGMTAGDFRDRIGDTRTQACPSCRTKMAPVMLDDTIGELCPGCGGMWLDSGELSALSMGRYDEIQGRGAA